MLNIAGTAMDQHRLYNMYPSLLKRLDDSNDNVRSVHAVYSRHHAMLFDKMLCNVHAI